MSSCRHSTRTPSRAYSHAPCTPYATSMTRHANALVSAQRAHTRLRTVSPSRARTLARALADDA
eukprot:1026310-Pleurochrysis_carterae.AAC.1